MRLAVLGLVTCVGVAAHAVTPRPPSPFAQISVSGRSTCTGAVVQMQMQRYFVTAAHCVAGLNTDTTITVSERAVVSRSQVVTRTGDLDLTVGDATVLPDFDVAMWPLKFYELTDTETLVPRLTELAPGEVVTAVGYPGDDGPTTVTCRAQSGTLTQVDGSGFRPAQAMTCATPLAALGGLSGGPALDQNGRYLGLIDYQSVSGVKGMAQVGFVPYRVFKPYPAADGTLTWGGLRYGFTFRDYMAAADGSVVVHATYARHGVGPWIGTVLNTIDLRAPTTYVHVSAAEASRITRLLMTVKPRDEGGHSRPGVDVSSYASVRSAIVPLRH